MCFVAGHSLGSLSVPEGKCGAKWHKNTAGVKIFCKQEGS